jgi:hypothetical protein
MTQSIRHGMPFLVAGQAQKEVTHNEALQAIDMKLHLGVASRSVSEAPDTPVAGDAYIVPSGATGVWSGAEGSIALFDGFGWAYSVPVRGSVAWVADERCMVVWEGSWSSGWPVSSLIVGTRVLFGAPAIAISGPQGGTVVDAEARAALLDLLSALRDQGILLDASN